MDETVVIPFGQSTLDRMVSAVEKVRQRLLMTVSALEKAGVPYAVIGAHAVAAWVERADESATRNTSNVDVMIRRSSLATASAALQEAGLIACESERFPVFVDDHAVKKRSGIRLFFAAERIHAADSLAMPDVEPFVWNLHATFRHVLLDDLVAMKLTAYRTVDRVHLIDMIEVGLVDQSWLVKFHSLLQERLREVLALAEEQQTCYN